MSGERPAPHRPRRRHATTAGALGASLAAAAVCATLLAGPAAAMDTPTPSPTAPAPTAPPTAPPTATPTPTPTPTLPVPVPVPVLPALADVVPSYQAQRSCDPAAKPGVEAYARMVLQTYRVGRNGGIVRGCGIGATSEHKEGRAFDFMLSVDVPAEKAAGDALTGWLTGPDSSGVLGGNARRLGVMYVIWNRRIWSTYAMGTGWRAYYGASPHTDHVHTSFSWNGAMKRTSWWTGRAVTTDDRGPCSVYAGQPAPVYTTPRLTACPTALLTAPASQHGIVWPGQTASAVKVAQAKLGVLADGVFGAGTRASLMSWQRQAALPVTGVLDKPTWARLDPPPPPPVTPTPTPSPTDSPTTAPTPTPTGSPTTAPTPPPAPPRPVTAITPYQATVLRAGARGAAVRALQTALRLRADGVLGASTTAAVAAVQTRAGLRGTGVVDAATWAAVEREAYPLLAYRSTVLRRFSTGPAVLALEKALRMKGADSAFGPATTAPVKAAQAAAGLPQTGVVDSATWAAVEARAFPLTVVPLTRQALARTTALTPFRTTTLRRGASGLVVAALQRSLGIGADGMFGPGTRAAVTAFQTRRHLPATGVVDTRTWAAVEATAYPLLPYRTLVLRPGSRGAAVAALQKALRQKADGRFGAPLLAAVRALQARNHLKVSGVVITSTWVAAERAAYPLGVRRW